MEVFFHVGLNCQEPRVTEAFYCRYFGYRRARVVELGDREIVLIKMQDCAAYLELFQAEGKSPIPPPTEDGYRFPGIRHFAYKVSDLDAKLQELGDAAPVTLGPLAFDEVVPGLRSAWVADPDGRIIELLEGFKDQDNPPLLTVPVPIPVQTT